MASPSISFENQHERAKFSSTGISSQPLLMTLRIEKGPLTHSENDVILAHYNRLTSSRIPMEEFLHWVQDSPEGPAWHAILENTDREIVGHCALVPFRGFYKGSPILAGKAEYAFILEEYQSAKIRGFESSGKPRNAIMIRQLFERCRSAGFDLMFISTNPAGQRSLWSVGTSTMQIPVRECLLVLRPWRAARSTPNLQGWQRAALFFVGLLQRGAASLVSAIWKRPVDVEVQSAGRSNSNVDPDMLSFFADAASQSWRFESQEYAQLTIATGDGHVVFKKGSADRYLRVCEWRLQMQPPLFTLASKLVELAKGQNALGVRWAVYGNEDETAEFSRTLRWAGFMSATRTRRLLVFAQNQDFLLPGNWKLNDAMFSFDP